MNCSNDSNPPLPLYALTRVANEGDHFIDFSCSSTLLRRVLSAARLIQYNGNVGGGAVGGGVSQSMCIVEDCTGSITLIMGVGGENAETDLRMLEVTRAPCFVCAYYKRGK